MATVIECQPLLSPKKLAVGLKRRVRPGCCARASSGMLPPRRRAQR